MIKLSAPGYPIKALVNLQGSKSISNRLLILRETTGLATTDFTNLSEAEDTRLLAEALRKIRAASPATLDVNHAGSDMRFLTAYLSVTPGEWILTGSERLKERPLSILVQALRALGASITYLEKEGFAPLKIMGRSLAGGEVSLDASVSSQFISALLLISPLLKEGITIYLTGNQVSRPYIDMTVELLKQFGVSVEATGNRMRAKGVPLLKSGSFLIESDWSSASYWYSICALSPGSEITLRSFSQKSAQADSVLPLIFEKLGVSTHFSGDQLVLSHTGVVSSEAVFDFSQSPDIAQTVAVTCFGLGIRARLTGLQTLKIKETDRILALATELEKLGAVVNATAETIEIEKRGKDLAGMDAAPVQTYHDHRMALSFAPLAMLTGTLRISSPEVVSKSYPTFWSDLKNAGFSVNLQP